MGASFRKDSAGMAKITRTMGREACVQAANRGLTFARANAPVRTGDYKASLHVEAAPVTVAGQTRMGAKLVADSDHGQWVEWGRGASHVLARAVDAIEKAG